MNYIGICPECSIIDTQCQRSGFIILNMDKKLQTVATYNASAESLSEKFDSQPARVGDIDRVFGYMEKSRPNVLEIGCGNGRDAVEIIKRTPDYLGIDISENLVALARHKVPEVHFEVADVESYAFSQNLDIVFAFASLLHVPKESLKEILKRAFFSLNDGGIFFLSLKYADEYEEVTKTDSFGVRTFYLYSQKDIKDVAGGFSVIESGVVELRGQKWLEVVMKKTDNAKG